MSAVPKWFTPLAVVALLWNLMGCAAYLMDVTITPEALAQMTPDQQAMYASRPSWAVAMTALAVWGGALGCVGLLMKRRWAKPALLVSLLGVLGQDTALFGMSGVAISDPSVYVLQGLVLVIAAALLVWANAAGKQGLLR